MQFISPSDHIQTVELSPGDVVVDAGAGSGAYTIAAAHAVTERGTVYAVDVHKELLARVHADATAQGLENVHTLWGDIELKNGIQLNDGVADAVLICNTLFMIEDKDGLMEEVKRILKEKGRLLIVDWSDSHGGVGPHADHVFLEKDARALIEKHGLHFVREVDGATHHYGFVAMKV